MIDTVILCGGMGWRARQYLGELPKCLAPIAGRPLIDHLLDYLEKQGIQRVVLALAHRAETVLAHLGPPPRRWGQLTVHCDLDKVQRGTGGAVLHVLGARLATDKPFKPPLLVINGDTLLRLNLKTMFYIHVNESAAYTTAVANAVPVARILSEKALDLLSEASSLEMALPPHQGISWLTTTDAFLDIGTPEGYAKAEDWVKLNHDHHPHTTPGLPGGRGD